MRRAIGIVALALAAAVFAIACSDKSTPSSPTSTLSVTGNWAGAVTVLGNETRMTWTLTQSNAAVSGPVLVGLSTGTVLLNGFLTGSLSGTTLTYTISVGPGGVPTQPTCTGQIGGTMAVAVGPPSTMTGPSTVTSSTCTPPFPGGTLALTKQ